MNSYINFINWIFGFYNYNNLFESSIIDYEGKLLFNSELALLDSQMLSVIISDFTNWNLSFDNVKYLVLDKNVSSMLYHYTSSGFFYNGDFNVDNFWTRKNFISLFWFNNIILDNSKKDIVYNYKDLNYTSYNFDKSVILRDTFFESQNFKHSTSFEFIWALFPTAIILSILVPSLYLLYSLDEDLDPKLTIKVIGHHDIDLMNLIIE